MGARVFPRWLLPSLPLGQMTDIALAKKLHVGTSTVCFWRNELGIPVYPRAKKDDFFHSTLYFDLQELVLERVGFHVPIPFRVLYRTIRDEWGPICEVYFRRALREMVAEKKLRFVSDRSGTEQGYMQVRR